MAPSWPDLGPQDGPKLGPKWDQNQSKNGLRSEVGYGSDFESILWSTWPQHGPILAPKMAPSWVQNGIKIGPKPVPEAKSALDPILGRFLVGLWSKKAVPKPIFFNLKLIFGSSCDDFG